MTPRTPRGHLRQRRDGHNPDDLDDALQREGVLTTVQPEDEATRGSRGGLWRTLRRCSTRRALHVAFPNDHPKSVSAGFPAASLRRQTS